MNNNGNSPSPYSYASYQMVDTESPNVRTLLRPYLRNWPWFVLSIGIALAGAYVYLLYKQPIYKSQASLLVMTEDKERQSDMLREVQVSAPKKVVENEIEILRSATLMKRIVDKLHLENQYYKQTQFGKRELYGDVPVELVVEKALPELYETPLNVTFVDGKTVRVNQLTYPLDQSVDTPYGRLRLRTRQAVSAQTPELIIRASDPMSVVDNFVYKLKAEPTSKTSSVVLLTLEDAVPAKGEAVLNGIIQEYNQAAVTDKNKVAANTLRFIQDRLDNVSGDLASVEKSVENYKSGQGITNLSAQAETFLATVKENDAELNAVNIKLSALNDLQKYINTQPENRGGTPATIGLEDPLLLGQINRVSDLELKREEQARTMGDQTPQMQALDRQIRNTKSNISENIQTMKSMLTSSKESYISKNQEIESRIRSIPQQERMLMDIERKQSIKNELYTYLLKKREEMAMAAASAISDSRTIDAAKTVLGPVKPVKPMIYLLFGLVGLIFPIGAIAAKDLFNNRVRRRSEVEEGAHVPILGELVKKRGRRELVITPKSRTLIAEQIRSLRASLLFLRNDSSDSQVLLFTSSIAGEGKSFISLNLGASLALVDRPTIILEMDLRIPKLHKVFNVDNSLGISNYLTGDATLEQVIKPMPGQQNYFIITSGTLQRQQNPTELLTGPRLEQLILELRERFAYVLLDAPPIGLVSDAQIMAPYADATLYVVRHDVTPKNYLKMIEAFNREQRFNKLNIVLNAVGGDDNYFFNDSPKNHYYDKEGKNKWLPTNYQSIRATLKR